MGGGGGGGMTWVDNVAVLVLMVFGCCGCRHTFVDVGDSQSATRLCESAHDGVRRWVMVDLWFVASKTMSKSSLFFQSGRRTERKKLSQFKWARRGGT